jgi:hypothetical protein
MSALHLTRLPPRSHQGEGSRVVATLTPEYLAAQTQPPVQPDAEKSTAARVIVKRTRIRDFSAQLLSIEDWRSEAHAWARQRRRDIRSAGELLRRHEDEQVQKQECRMAGGGAHGIATATPILSPAFVQDSDEAHGEGFVGQHTTQPHRRPRVPLADKFPIWRRVKPPRIARA